MTTRSERLAARRAREGSARRCRSCGAPVEWRTLDGRPHPYDAGKARSHFDTCPDAASWRAANRYAVGLDPSTTSEDGHDLVGSFADAALLEQEAIALEPIDAIPEQRGGEGEEPQPHRPSRPPIRWWETDEHVDPAFPKPVWTAPGGDRTIRADGHELFTGRLILDKRPPEGIYRGQHTIRGRVLLPPPGADHG